MTCSTAMPPVAHAAAIRLDFRNPGPEKNLSWRAATFADGDRRRSRSVRAAGLNFPRSCMQWGCCRTGTWRTVLQGHAGYGTVGRGTVGPEVADLSPGDEIAFAPASFAGMW